ncbi:MAG TPA: hypothetical protein VH593_03585, partial [Ktedonobacteraceae bacterium]
PWAETCGNSPTESADSSTKTPRQQLGVTCLKKEALSENDLDYAPDLHSRGACVTETTSFLTGLRPVPISAWRPGHSVLGVCDCIKDWVRWNTSLAPSGSRRSNINTDFVAEFRKQADRYTRKLLELEHLCP